MYQGPNYCRFHSRFIVRSRSIWKVFGERRQKSCLFKLPAHNIFYIEELLKFLFNRSRKLGIIWLLLNYSSNIFSFNRYLNATTQSLIEICTTLTCVRYMEITTKLRSDRANCDFHVVQYKIGRETLLYYRPESPVVAI